MLSRQAVDHEGVTRIPAAPPQPGLWREPVNALKAETAWFHEEAKRMFELLTLPVLQLFAAAINFAVVIVQSRPHFILPFTSLEDILAATPVPFNSRSSGDKGRMRTPMDPMPRIAS